MPLWSGNMTIYVNITARYKNINTHFQARDDALAKIDTPKIEFNLPSSVDSNAFANISFTFDNSDSEFDFTTVQANISSELFEDMNYEYVGLSGGAHLGNDMDFKAPFAQSAQKFYVILSYSYLSRHNEKFHDVINRSITVNRVEFEPHIIVDVADYWWNSTDNDTMYNLSLIVHVYSNVSVSSVNINTVIGKQEFSIQPSRDELAGNGSNYSVNLIFNKTVSFSQANIEVEYEQDTDQYFFKSYLPVKTPEILAKEKARVAVQVPGNQSDLFKKPSAFDYVKGGGIRNVKVEYKQMDPRYIAAGGVVILFLVLMVAYLVVFPRRAAKRMVKKLKRYELVEKTESLSDIENPEITKIEMHEVEEAIPLPSADLDLLEHHIKSSLEKGKSKDKIKKELLEKGWLEDIVEVYLR